MRAVCFEGVQSVGLRTLPEPRISAATDAIVQVEVAGLCGSDLHPYFGREVGLDAGTAMGHEFVGRVVEVGGAVQSTKPGDRVFAPFTTNCGDCYYCRRGLTCRCIHSQLFGWRQGGRGLHGGQAEFVLVPWADGTLKQVSPGLSNEAALLLGDNFSTGYFAAESADVGPDGVWVVIGCGTVGLLTIVAARMLGARTIFGIDPVEHRRTMAAELGAVPLAADQEAIAAIRAATDGRGADGVMELVGLPDAQRLALATIRPGGVIAAIGCHCTEHFAFSPVEAYDKNVTYRTGRCPARYYMDLLTDRVVRERIDLSRFITHRFELADCSRGYAVFSQRADGCLKAVFDVS